MKGDRHHLIVQLIRTYEIDTQEELMRRLQESGVSATQATISRDIKDLRIVKGQDENGKYRYMLPEARSERAEYGRFHSLLPDAVEKVDYAGHMVVLKCAVGMAQAICAVLDSMKWETIVGTLAGDDTIFCVMRTEEQARELTEELKKLL